MAFIEDGNLADFSQNSNPFHFDVDLEKGNPSHNESPNTELPFFDSRSEVSVLSTCKEPATSQEPSILMTTPKQAPTRDWLSYRRSSTSKRSTASTTSIPTTKGQSTLSLSADSNPNPKSTATPLPKGLHDPEDHKLALDQHLEFWQKFVAHAYKIDRETVDGLGKDLDIILIFVRSRSLPL